MAPYSPLCTSLLPEIASEIFLLGFYERARGFHDGKRCACAQLCAHSKENEARTNPRSRSWSTEKNEKNVPFALFHAIPLPPLYEDMFTHEHCHHKKDGKKKNSYRQNERHRDNYTANREMCVITVFSPNFCTASSMSTPTVTSGFLINGCSKNTRSPKYAASFPSIIFFRMSSGFPELATSFAKRSSVFF